MSKGFKIILGTGVVIVLGISIFFASQNSSNQPPQQQNQESTTSNVGQDVQNQLPEYILPTIEENRVKEFAFNFIKLYNTYSFSDYSSVLALGDYETALMQEKTLEFVANLEKNVSVGYMQEADVDQSYFVYEYPSASTLKVKTRVKLSQYSNYYPKPELDFGKSYIPKLENTQDKEFVIELSKYGKNWLVNSIEILK